MSEALAVFGWADRRDGTKMNGCVTARVRLSPKQLIVLAPTSTLLDNGGKVTLPKGYRFWRPEAKRGAAAIGSTWSSRWRLLSILEEVPRAHV